MSSRAFFLRSAPHPSEMKRERPVAIGLGDLQWLFQTVLLNFKATCFQATGEKKGGQALLSINRGRYDQSDRCGFCIPSSFLQPRLNCVWKCTALRTGSLQLWLVVETFLSCLVYIHFNAICLQDEDIKQEGTEDIQKVWFKVHYIHSFYNVFRLSYCITNKAHLKTYCFSKTTVCLIVW